MLRKQKKTFQTNIQNFVKKAVLSGRENTFDSHLMRELESIFPFGIQNKNFIL